MSKEQLNKEAEGIVDRFLESEFVAKVKLIAYTVRDLLIIFVPLGVTTYLFHTQEDRIVLGIGVAIGLAGVLNIIKLAYGYEKLSKASTKRR